MRPTRLRVPKPIVDRFRNLVSILALGLQRVMFGLQVAGVAAISSTRGRGPRPRDVAGPLCGHRESSRPLRPTSNPRRQSVVASPLIDKPVEQEGSCSQPSRSSVKRSRIHASGVPTAGSSRLGNSRPTCRRPSTRHPCAAAQADGARQSRLPQLFPRAAFQTRLRSHFDGGLKIGSQRSSGGLSIRARQRARNNAAGGSSGKREKLTSARTKSRARQAWNPSA